jgi:hypothetical protein
VSFDSPDSAARLRAIQRAAAEDDRSSIPKLIEMLDSDDSAVRLLSIRTLESMTGQTLGYDPFAPSYERTPAVNRWQEWYAAQQAPSGEADTEHNVYKDAGANDRSSASDPIPSGDRNTRRVPGSKTPDAEGWADPPGSSSASPAGDAGATE